MAPGLRACMKEEARKIMSDMSKEIRSVTSAAKHEWLEILVASDAPQHTRDKAAECLALGPSIASMNNSHLAAYMVYHDNESAQRLACMYSDLVFVCMHRKIEACQGREYYNMVSRGRYEPISGSPLARAQAAMDRHEDMLSGAYRWLGGDWENHPWQFNAPLPIVSRVFRILQLHDKALRDRDKYASFVDFVCKADKLKLTREVN